MCSELKVYRLVPNALKGQAIQIVQNVLTFCKYEAMNNRLLGGLFSNYMQRAYFYTGVPKVIMNEIKKDEMPQLQEPDPNLLIEIRRILKKFYCQHELPTCQKLHAMIIAQKRVPCPDLVIFNFQLVELGYENILLKTTPPTEMLIESPRVTFQRFRYLQKLIKARGMNRKIYYLSVKVYDKNRKGMVPLRNDRMDNLLTEPQLLLLYHIVSKDGYEDGLFTYSYDADNLKSWILNIVGPILQQSTSSLIILDDSTCYGKPSQHNISCYHPKKEMVKWLKRYNLPCDPNMHKADLFALIEKCSVKHETNSIENILKSMGHDVLYLPRFNAHLSPIEWFWKYLNNKLRKITFTDTLPDTEKEMNKIKGFIVEEISSLTSQDLWATYDEVVKKTEEELLTLDTEIESYIDQCEIDYDSIM